MLKLLSGVKIVFNASKQSPTNSMYYIINIYSKLAQTITWPIQLMSVSRVYAVADWNYTYHMISTLKNAYSSQYTKVILPNTYIYGHHLYTTQLWT